MNLPFLNIGRSGSTLDQPKNVFGLIDIWTKYCIFFSSTKCIPVNDRRYASLSIMLSCQFHFIRPNIYLGSIDFDIPYLIV